MPEELNSQASSQPPASNSAQGGTNAEGKPSEAVGQSNMTSSQSTDYYNKTQQLAQQRREFEAEKAAFENQRASYYRQNGDPQQSQGYPSQGVQTPPNQLQQQIGTQVDVQTYASLVEQFGKDGADAMVRLNQLSMAPVLQQQSAFEEQTKQTKIALIEQNLNAKGSQDYGEEWNTKDAEGKTKGENVINFIKQYGVPLSQAWYAVNGPSLKQAGVDAAYQNQEAKSQGNVNQANVQPKGTQPAEITGFGDAFESAWNEHNS